MIKNEFDWYIQFNKMQNLNDMIGKQLECVDAERLAHTRQKKIRSKKRKDTFVAAKRRHNLCASRGVGGKHTEEGFMKKGYLLHNAQNDVKKLEAIDEYLHEVYRQAEHSFKSKTGTSFNQTSLNDDFITSYIEWHPSLKHDSCIKMVFVYNTANETITLDVDMTPEEYQKAAKRFVDQFEITFGRSLESECNARLSHCDLDALTGIPYGKRQ